jgi:hypothetical protein
MPPVLIPWRRSGQKRGASIRFPPETGKPVAATAVGLKSTVLKRVPVSVCWRVFLLLPSGGFP